MVLTQDAARLERLQALRVHGMPDRIHAVAHGGNWRLDALQAAILRAKLPLLQEWLYARSASASRYDALLQNAHQIVLPPRVHGDHAWNQYVIRVQNRDAVQRRMQEQGVDCRVYYPLPLHLQPAFSFLGYAKGDFPEAEKAAQEVLSLPLYPELTDAQAAYVVEQLLIALS